MKKTFLISIVAMAFFTCFAYGQPADVDDYLGQKISIYNNSDDVNDVEVLEKELSKLRGAENNYDDELFLTLENNLVIDIADMTPKSNDTKKKIYLLLSNQNKKNTSYMEGKKLKKLNSDYLVSVADLKCRFIDYLAKQENYEESMFAEELYKQAIKNNKKNPMAYVGYGTWLFFAPPIVGGGIEAANKKYETAVKYAKSPNAKYFALLYYSQSLFSLGDNDGYENALKEAASIAESNVMVQAVRDVNEKNILFFE